MIACMEARAIKTVQTKLLPNRSWPPPEIKVPSGAVMAEVRRLRLPAFTGRGNTGGNSQGDERRDD